MRRDLGFVGVDTQNSAICRIFPLWADRLSLPGRAIRGFNIPLDADDTAYRGAVASIKDSADLAGALITSHKVRVYQAARDMFDELCDFAPTCGEISSISKRHGQIRGHAKDPDIAGAALNEIIDRSYFSRTNADVVCLGVGGSGAALGWAVASREDRPARVILADVRPGALDRAREQYVRSGRDHGCLEYRLLDATDPAADASALVSECPPGTLVVNATGMGKDRPGSPVDDTVVFPERSIAWEFNYRGRLNFAAQAGAQAHTRQVSIYDGWRYFIRGWLQVVEDAYEVPIPPPLARELADLAAGVRTGRPT